MAAPPGSDGGSGVDWNQVDWNQVDWKRSEGNRSEWNRADGQNPLNVPPDLLRDWSYAAMDLVLERWARRDQEPPLLTETPAHLHEMLGGPPPEGPEPFPDILDRTRQALDVASRLDHPRFFAYVPGPSSYPGVLAALLAAGWNAFAGTWMEGNGPVVLECVTVGWLADWLGMPSGSGGLFVPGGSLANLTGLAAGRQAVLGGPEPEAVAYASDQTHASVARALRVIGVPHYRMLPTDDLSRLCIADLATAIGRDRRMGLKPFAVVANAGTTNTGAVDALPAVRNLCDREGLWLHVDGAYGAPAVLTDRGRSLLRGIGDADSVTVDPHKWLFAPYECSALLVRDPAVLPTTFADEADYLSGTSGESRGLGWLEAPSLGQWGVQLSRGLTALRVWMTVRAHGMAAIRGAVQRGLDLAEYTGSRIRELPEWEMTSPPWLGVVTFRYAHQDVPDAVADRLTVAAARHVSDSGFAYLAPTRLRGRAVLRLCTINPGTTEADLDITVAMLDDAARWLRRGGASQAA